MRGRVWRVRPGDEITLVKRGELRAPAMGVKADDNLAVTSWNSTRTVPAVTTAA
jgi:hypothetical protein